MKTNWNIVYHLLSYIIFDDAAFSFKNRPTQGYQVCGYYVLSIVISTLSGLEVNQTSEHLIKNPSDTWRFNLLIDKKSKRHVAFQLANVYRFPEDGVSCLCINLQEMNYLT